MQILKLKQEIHCQTQLSEAEILKRLSVLLDVKNQKAPNFFAGNIQNKEFEIYSVNAGLWITPIVRGTFSNGQVRMKLEPSNQFKLVIIIVAIIASGLLISIIFDSPSYWYSFPIFVVFFLLVVNLEGLRNYRNIMTILERTLDLTIMRESRPF